MMSHVSYAADPAASSETTESNDMSLELPRLDDGTKAQPFVGKEEERPSEGITFKQTTSDNVGKASSQANTRSDAPVVHPLLARESLQATRDWHKEMLLGLFLRCQRSELCQLAARTGTSFAASPPSRSRLAAYGSPDAASSVLTLLPHVIAGFSRDDTTRSSTEVPPRWKRPDHRAQPIEATARRVMTLFQKAARTAPHAPSFPLSSRSAPLSRGGNIAAPPTVKRPVPSSSFHALPIMYNECSLSAIGTWAASHRKKPPDSSSVMSSSYDRPAAPPFFRRCNCCGTWGHYEVECDSKSRKQLLTLSQMTRVQRIVREFVEEETHRDDLRLDGETKRSQHLSNDSTRNNAIHDSQDQNDDSLHTLMKEDKNASEQHKQQQEATTTTLLPFGTIPKQRKKATKLVVSPLSPLSEQQKSTPLVAEKGTMEHIGVTIKFNAASSATNNSSPCDTNTNKDSDSDNDGNVVVVEKNNEYPTTSTACKICNSGFRGQDLLLCDGCDGLFHRQCLTTPLEKVPEGDWYCLECDHFDSDVSSVAEIEGHDGFVMEQRKRSMIEEEAWGGGCCEEEQMRVGFDEDDYCAAVSIMMKRDDVTTTTTTTEGKKDTRRCRNDTNDVEDDRGQSSHIQEYNDSRSRVESGKNSAIASAVVDLAPGELCWAKRRGAEVGKLGRDEWWPSMVIQVSDTRTGPKTDEAVPPTTPYIVKFFTLQGAGRVRASDVLSFFPNYEEIRHRQLTISRGKPGHEEFRTALLESTAEMGCKTLGQALKKAREIASGDGERHPVVMDGNEISNTTLESKESNNVIAARATIKSVECHVDDGRRMASLRPPEWANADKTEEDGFVILARSKGSPHTSRTNNRVQDQMARNYAQALAYGADEKDAPHELHGASVALDGIAQPQRSSPSSTIELPSIERLIGGIVGWTVTKSRNVSSAFTGQGTQDHTSVEGQSKLQLGVAVGVNKAHRKVLVRCLSNLDDVASSVAAARIQASYEDGEDDDNNISIYSCRLGPSMWVRFDSLMLVSDGPSPGARDACRTTLDAALKAARDRISARRSDEAIRREENMVELVSLPTTTTATTGARNNDPVVSGQANNRNGTLVGNVNSRKKKRKIRTQQQSSSTTASTGFQHLCQSPMAAREDLLDCENNAPVVVGRRPTSTTTGRTKRCGRKGGLFQAERILDERVTARGTKEYLIKWRGFGNEDNTWESEKNILNQNFVRMYRAERLSSELRDTPEARDERSLTFKIIRGLEAGKQLLANNLVSHESDRSTKGRRKCPFCLASMRDSASFGGHVKLHMKEPNYSMIRESVRMSDDCWFDF